MIKFVWLIAPALLFVSMAVNPVSGEDNTSLSYELSRAREAWLYADAETAGARLDALREDDRLSGELPRWYTFMRAALALETGDAETAWQVAETQLIDCRDARNYLRASRLFLTYGEPALAERAIDAGLKRKADSPGLLRFKAGLQWLDGRIEPALQTYLEIMSLDKRPTAPYVIDYSSDWQDLPSWNGDDEDPPPPSDNDAKDDEDEEKPEPTEPHVSLFTPVVWYTTSLPGLARCVQEAVSRPELVADRQARHQVLIAQAKRVQGILDSYRGGDVEERAQLEQNARRAAFEALINTRIVARAGFNADEYEKAEELAQSGLEINNDDVALLDLMAQIYGKLGKAEEARTTVLTSLVRVAGLRLGNLLRNGPDAQALDRILEPACTLYKANPDAGRAQINELRKQFDQSRGDPVLPGVLGVWLYLRGDADLARKFLIEFSRFSGHDSGKALSSLATVVELALLAIGEGDAQDEPNPDNPDKPEPEPEGDEPAPEGEEEEVESVAMAKVGDAHPLLRKALRAGGVMGSTIPVTTRMGRIAGISLWGSNNGMGSLVQYADALPEGNALIYNTLFEVHKDIARDVKPEELEAFIAPEHSATVALKQALTGLGASCEQYRANSSWRLRRTIQEQAAPIFGMIEARAILLRAQMLHDRPQNLLELSAWLKRHQELLNARQFLQKTPRDDYTKAVEARKEAGYPEVVHKGLLLDAAKLLAESDKPLQGAKLIWLNRRALAGMESSEHLLWFASVLARAGGDSMLSARCRIEGAGQADLIVSNSQEDVAGNLIELTLARKNLLEYGTPDDVLGYVETLMPMGVTGVFEKMLDTAPELKDAPESLVMRNTRRNGVDAIFQASAAETSNAGIAYNWAKLIYAKENLPVCHRLGAWMICNDFGRGNYNGCADAYDTVVAWRMILLLYEREGSADKAARLKKLLANTANNVR